MLVIARKCAGMIRVSVITAKLVLHVYRRAEFTTTIFATRAHLSWKAGRRLGAELKNPAAAVDAQFQTLIEALQSRTTPASARCGHLSDSQFRAIESDATVCPALRVVARPIAITRRDRQTGCRS